MHNTSAAQLYETEEQYQRYNQKYNLLIQAQWNEPMVKLYQEYQANMLRSIRTGKPGYDLLSYAHYLGARNYLSHTGFNINYCDQNANSWTGRPELQGGVIAPYFGSVEELTRSIKNAAKSYGVDAVGVTRLDRRWVYSHWYDPERQDAFPIVFSDEAREYRHIEVPTRLADGSRVIPAKMENVLVFLFAMDYEWLRRSSTMESNAGNFNLYARMSLAASVMAEMIRTLGYNAIPSINCTALSVPLAIDAGLGQMGRNGKLVNPHFGARVKIAKIITDMPLVTDAPIDFGVTAFCDACRTCVKACPAGAISGGSRTKTSLDESGNAGYLKWGLDHKKCFDYWSQCGSSCNICVTVCSYNRGHSWMENILSSVNTNTTLLDALLDTLEDDSFGLEARDSKLDDLGLLDKDN